MVTRHIEEVVIPDKRLGRHVEHDPASRDFAYGVEKVAVLQTVLHKRHGSIFNQGNIGSCTGNATAGAINTEPNYKVDLQRILHETDAVSIYELATRLDSYPGSYPPDDTGSSGLSACKAAKQKGWITSYQHAFTMDQALAALQSKPVITGVHWYEGFDNPDANGMVEISGQVRGGHEFVVVGFELGNKPDHSDAILTADNSWNTSWGLNGKFRFTVTTWATLLAEQGDVTVPIA